jgi:hypothetical protein
MNLWSGIRVARTPRNDNLPSHALIGVDMPRKRRFKPTRKPRQPIENGGPEVAASSGRDASSVRAEELQANTTQSLRNEGTPTSSSCGGRQ